MIYEHQKKVFRDVFTAARAFSLSLDLTTPFKPRFYPLIVGPTGCGKTHIARSVATALGWPYLVINANGWIVLGAKETGTWREVEEWVRNKPTETPLVIILDEIDKAVGETDWNHHLQVELFQLLDKVIPPQCQDDPSDVLTEEESIDEAFKRVFFIGCGAFQSQQEKAVGCGFRPTVNRPESLDALSKTLPRELVNRFAAVHSLRGLERAEYEAMAEMATKSLPKELRKFFKEKCKQRIEQAIADKTGARFIEVALADMLIDTARELEEADEIWKVPDL
jgi:ATP-dependent Clp protease ATP-binding subunit ClpX